VAQLYPRHWVPFLSPFTNRRATTEVIRICLHTLEGQSAIPWRINSRRTAYSTTPPTVPPLFAFVFIVAQAWIGRVESHVTTDRQSDSPPRNKAPIWDLRPEFHHCQTVAGTLMCGDPANERTGPPPLNAAGPRQSSRSRARVPRPHSLTPAVSIVKIIPRREPHRKHRSRIVGHVCLNVFT
jgi:hypothetical protein